MLSKPIGFIICLFCLLLPWRLRVLAGEVLGWIIQFFYFTYYGIFNFLLRELREAREKQESNEKK